MRWNSSRSANHTTRPQSRAVVVIGLSFSPYMTGISRSESLHPPQFSSPLTRLRHIRLWECVHISISAMATLLQETMPCPHSKSHVQFIRGGPQSVLSPMIDSRGAIVGWPMALLFSSAAPEICFGEAQQHAEANPYWATKIDVRHWASSMRSIPLALGRWCQSPQRNDARWVTRHKADSINLTELVELVRVESRLSHR